MCMSAVDHLHVSNSIPINITCNIDRGYLNKVKNVTLCRVASSLNILNPNTEVILKTSNNEKVDGFHAEKKTIYWLPKFVDNQASNLRALSVVGSHLKELTQDCLKLMKNLQSLDLTGNDIKTLEKKPFEHNKKLIYINLTQNKIKFVESTTFDKLEHLAHLYLHVNDCFTNGANAKDKKNVQKLIKILNNSCGNTNKINDVKYSTITETSTKTAPFSSETTTTSVILNNTTTTEQNVEYPVLSSSTSEPYLIYNDQKSMKIIILLIILVVFIVICSSLVCYIISKSKRNRSQSSNRQPKRNVRISLVNNYTTLPFNKPENLNDNDINLIEMDQRVTLGIYEEILEYQRIPDDTYQSPLDDSSNYIIETTSKNLNIELSQDDLYAKVNDELYQEIMCHDLEALGDPRTVRLEDDTYNDPKDVFHQNLEDSYNYAELNPKLDDKNQQNITQDSIELDKSQTVDQSLESEDLYAETTMEKQQEYDLYATIQKV